MLKPIAQGLWIHESSVRFYGVRVRTRMTVAALDDGGIWLHSPTIADEALRAEVAELGPVTALVSPNKIHHQALGDWARAFPTARLHASPGLPERRPDLSFASVLGDSPEPQWASVLDQAATSGNVFFSEILFLHRLSRSLIVADLVENFDANTTSRIGLWLARAFGVPQRPVASPEFRYYTLDADAAEASLARPRSWDFDRIVLAHGALIEREARAVFDAVCEELLATVRGRSSAARRLFAWLARRQ